MADKVAKLLAKLPKKDLARIREALSLLNCGELTGLDIKTLKGKKGVYRLRTGGYRIVFTRDKLGRIKVLLIAKRDEKTYLLLLLAQIKLPCSEIRYEQCRS